MPYPSFPSWNGSDVEVASCATSTLPRRVRHITSIQIRNLTPFPARDSLTFALKKPSEQPQFTPYGHLSDDLDVTVGRKRGRRISTTSSTHSSTRSEEDGASGSLEHPGEPTIRRRTSSRASIPLSTSVGSSSPKLTRRPSTVGTTSNVRHTHRSSTLSISSSHSHQVTSPSSAPSGVIGTSTSSIFPDLLPDTSQKNLEKILQSRLVETFITITLLPSGAPKDDAHSGTCNGKRAESPQVSPSPSRPTSPPRFAKDKVVTSRTLPRRGTVGAGSTPATSRSHTAPTRHVPSPSVPPTKGLLSNHSKSASVSLPNGRLPKPPLTASPQTTRFPTLPSSTQSTSTILPSSSSKTWCSSVDSDKTLPVPDYISPIHWPSTNPVFQLSRYEFAAGTDLSGARMRIEVWGRTSKDRQGSGWRLDNLRQNKGKVIDTKGKGKERDAESVGGDLQWRVLETWEVALGELRLLPEDLVTTPTHVPFNTLLITLASGERLYLPSRSLQSNVPSRAPSPNAGYNSDPEGEVHKVRSSAEISLQTPMLESSRDSIPNSPTISESDEGLHVRRKRAIKSASWQDLLKLINLQTVILDTEQSLGEVVRQIDKAVVHNDANILAREVSEREAWVVELQEGRFKINRDMQSLRDRIAVRREDLARRRELLERARQLHNEDLERESRVEETVSKERDRLSTLRNLLPIMRSNLISIVAFIYPIELVSPPDLLFSILDVPLPIPIAATDPAPPLSLPMFKDVTEDSVATALGYSAQVVQLLAAYMGHRLVYPVTCVGSRSMIKDGISAMVGPRNFPLFSKSVDTYRFEYGVFLLNKDIELLMSERNLRALDMRHTLPNLKNLLLTLTDNEQRSIPSHRVASSSVSISSLQSQSPVPAKVSLARSEPTSGTGTEGSDTIDKQASSASGPASSEDGTAAGTPPTSGTTTPTKAAPRKSRAFLDLAPLTGFLTLRGRYTASQKPSVKPVAEAPDSEAQASLDGASPTNASANGSAAQDVPAADADGGDDEDDRRTIRGIRPGGTGNDGENVDGMIEGKVIAGGDARCNTANGREKVVEDSVARSPPLIMSS